MESAYVNLMVSIVSIIGVVCFLGYLSRPKAPRGPLSQLWEDLTGQEGGLRGAIGDLIVAGISVFLVHVFYVYSPYITHVLIPIFAVMFFVKSMSIFKNSRSMSGTVYEKEQRGKACLPLAYSLWCFAYTLYFGVTWLIS